jgi:inosose dehydratase
MDRYARRDFFKTIGATAGAALLPALTSQAAAKRLAIGHTGITWGYRPENAEQAIKDVAAQGYSGFESFGNVIEAWEEKGGFGRMLDSAKLPLISAYCGVNLTDASKRKEEIEKMVRWGKLIKKYGGSVVVIGPNNVRRPGYDFKANKDCIIATLNDLGTALTDAGVTGAVHQHTGTCIENRDEVYAVMEAVNTKTVKFGPDIGQLQKGGSDPVKVVNDFLSVIRHVHLKDFDGGPNWVGYCPLGKGKVDIPAVLNALEKAPEMKIAMVELDPENPTMTQVEALKISKDYLKTLGYTFRS